MHGLGDMLPEPAGWTVAMIFILEWVDLKRGCRRSSQYGRANDRAPDYHPAIGCILHKISFPQVKSGFRIGLPASQSGARCPSHHIVNRADRKQVSPVPVSHRFSWAFRRGERAAHVQRCADSRFSLTG